MDRTGTGLLTKQLIWDGFPLFGNRGNSKVKEMGRQDDQMRSRYKVGFFSSLTPMFYLVSLVGVGILVAATMLTVRGCDSGQGDAVVPRAQAPAQPPAQAEDIGSPRESPTAFALKEKVVLPEQDAPAARMRSEKQAAVLPETGPPDSVDAATGFEDPPPQPASKEAAGSEESQPSAVPAPLPASVAEPRPTPAQPEPAQEGKISAETPSPGGRWVVQLSANRREDLALSWAARINDLNIGATAYVLERQTEGEPLHVLRMGFFTTKEEAQAMAGQVGARLGLQEGMVLKGTSAERDLYASRAER